MHMFLGLGFGSGSGSGAFYHHAKIVRKTLIPTISNKVISRKNKTKIVFCGILKVSDENSRIRIQDPDPVSGSGSTPKCRGSATLQ
jgi:hypothetical protein